MKPETEAVQPSTAQPPQGPEPPAADVDELRQRVEQLERANRELMRANADLARARLGPRDSAANALLLRLRRAEKRVEAIERSVSWQVTAPLRLLKPPLKVLRAWLRSLRERVRQRLRR